MHQSLSSRFLKLFMLGAAITSSGKLFQVSVHLVVNENLRRVVLGLNLAIFKEWPRVFGA